jgi:hypothetical protein
MATTEGPLALGDIRLRATGAVALLLLSAMSPVPALARGPALGPSDAVCVPPSAAAATSTVYLPNITRRLGGPDGFYTPFIIQNTGSANTDLEVTFYTFTDGTCVQQYRVSNLAPGAAHSNNPNDDVRNTSLPDDAQFSVVVRSFGSTIVGVVNEHQNSSDPLRAEAMSYDGFNGGAKIVYLPNITRKFFGLFNTPFIIQNLGSVTTSVNASFKPFDGNGPTIVIQRVIDPGRAKAIDPESDDPSLGAPGLTDNKQYAVTVTSNQDVAVVVNTQADKPSVANPIAFATNGITKGAETIYGAYAAKNVSGSDRYSPIIVQNLGVAAVTPKITFTTFDDFNLGTDNTYTFPAIQPNASRAFDPRFSFSTQGTTNTPCDAGGPDCLANGEYSFKIEAPGGTIAAQVNVSGDVIGQGYTASASPGKKAFLPNVPKGLCFCPVPNLTAGWSGYIYLQSVSAASITLRWYSTATGMLAHTETFSIRPGRGLHRSPWSYPELAPDREYSVVAESGGGTINIVVSESARYADNAMIYEGFPGQ